MTEYGRIHKDGSRSGGQPTQSDALTIARAALARIEAATRNEVRAGDRGYISRYGINGIARAALQEQNFNMRDQTR